LFPLTGQIQVALPIEADSFNRDMSDPSSSTSTLQSLFEAALQNYEEQTRMRLIDHPLAQQLENCNSVESIISILQEQARAFMGVRREDGKVMKPLKRIVQVLHATSATLGGAMSLVRWIALVVLQSYCYTR